MLAQIWNDFRYAMRRLSASPGFTAAAVLTIALGVGINTGIFSLLNGFALRDLPAPNADDLVSIHQLLDDATRRQRFRSGAPSMFSTSEYRAYRDDTRTLSGIMGYSRWSTVTLGGEVPQEIVGTLVTCNYFNVLQQTPNLGPGFERDCDVDGAAPTVVLGHDLWTSAFGADPGIVGRDVLLNRQPFTVVGIAPAGVRGVDMVPVSFFVPISTQPLLDPAGNTYRGEWSWLTLIGRKSEDASLDQVRAELGLIAARIDAQQPPRRTMLVIARASPSSAPEDRAEMLPGIVVVMTAFGLVLLIACANVANLLLARSTGRAREIAVRLSLGASRGRVIQQLLAESILIAMIGGALGSLLAMWSSQSLVFLALTALPPDLPAPTIDTSPDSRVLAFALVVTLTSGVLFGLAPALHSSKPDLHTAMKADVSGAGRRRGRLQATLLGVQVAVSMVLVISAGLLLRGLYTTQTVDPGFAYENVAVASFNLRGAGYDEARAAVFQRQLAERVGALPGIEAVAQATTTPLALGGMGFTARLPDQDQQLLIRFNTVSANYFSVLGLPIIRGRTFTDAEAAVEGITGGGVMIVTEATARRFWPDQDPLGQTLLFGGAADASPVRVVGVVKDAEITRVGEIPSDFAYFPAGPAIQIRQQLLARSRADLGATASAIRTAAAEVDPGLVVRVSPLEANLDTWRSLAGLVSTLSTSLGILALVLAAVGIYGVVAYAVSLRLREIGIRRALGAGTLGVLVLMLRRTMRPVVIGAIVGVAAAAGVSRILSSVLFGVSPLDPLGLGAATLFVVVVALVAGGVPARRATRVDPMTTLRYE